MDAASNSVWIESALGAIKAFAFVCDIITYPVYLLLQRPWQKRQMSRRVKAKPVNIDGKSITFRSVQGPQTVHSKMLANGIDTMEKMLLYVVEQFKKKRCLGTREILAEEDEIQPNGRVFKKYVLGEYKWKTYEEVNMLASHFGKGLRELGHQPKQNIVIFAETRAEWMVAAHGCFKQNIPVVTIYATLGEDAIAHGINETEVNIVITTYDLLPKFKNILKDTPKVQTLIYMEDQLKKPDLDGFKKGTEIITFSSVIEKGKTSKISENSSPTKNDTAIIMYTSGSTGVPKGVILTHQNMTATMGSFSDSVQIGEDNEDVFLGFLPLAHVFELLAESVCLLCGVSIGYSTPLTMIDSSSKIKRGTKGDASVLHPTCLTAVPLILDRIYKGVYDKVSKGSPFQKALFEFAFNYKKKWLKRGFSTPFVDRVIFSKTKQLMGGRLRLILTGGAPLSPDTHELIKICLCDTVIQGYGLTETCSCATVMDLHDRSNGRAGNPATVCDIRLIDWDEGNYRVSDKPFPRGEICIGGKNISPGYYKNAEKTKEDFFEDDGKRWFRTGDIGECHADGVFKIIDRKKDLVKLQAGEYVSLGKVESELKTCPVVENICVYGDSNKDYTVALVVPNPAQLQDLATKLGRDQNISFEKLCEDPAMEQSVLQQLQIHGKKCKLEKFEVPAAVKLCTEVWSPDMGLVTAAFKLKRKDIQERYQKDINRMYGVS
ncbi:long-chain-fatty-acid--CoA ligase 4 isoform X2 [Nilaparvata lugens]|nr:long-chain-fatty-acid--CoA ligase 4 isoform X2 [Nilaparvata lugens]XP_039279985.1 long-chain-fatty-acid--CoA ligase 4 isoform X2 [Nilaparvata lugens]XP_039279986.1 long-chain-fatty-acid--CoA ligase 4 isoform X2 [Nilaparvata lugens]